MADADFIRLRNVLRQVKGKWLLSHSDDSFIRGLFKDFEVMEVKTKYSMAGGTHEGSPGKQRRELLIANSPIATNVGAGI